ncbi:MAG: hypothetical protein CSA97_03295 [Bacteroidetes bacterium]|nr:MAG: hypothetical protein CSA97_03295 [Bacteroidota bacterium]
MNGQLYLIPAPIGANPTTNTLTPHGLEMVRQLRYFAVENARSARRYLSALGMPVPITELSVELVDKNTDVASLPSILAPVLAGSSMGIISEAGCPGIADPGALLVELAHAEGIEVIPLPGPSSILMALMASGLNGQSFAFNGYLPIERGERRHRLRELEGRATREGQTQAFIETPYRNDKLLEEILQSLRPATRLTIAYGIDTKGGWIRTRSVSDWRRAKPNLGKVPTVFAIL